MSLKPNDIGIIPKQTARIAHAAFPSGNPYLTLRDELGTLYRDEDFSSLFPIRTQPALSPWRLALITILQFRENLSDRQAADAVRARIDWKYLLGLELTDPGFNFSVLSEFRSRLITGDAAMNLLETMLEHCRSQGLLKARGRQRTDSTHVLASVRVLSRLELIGETLRAALNDIAAVDPEWLQQVAPQRWYETYKKRIEDSRLPHTDREREKYAITTGEDGFTLLALLAAPATPTQLKELPKVAALCAAWSRHFELDQPPTGGPPKVRFKTTNEVAKAREQIESPYDLEARYRSKRTTYWTGYMVHVSETCDDDSAHLITHIHTTAADVHEAMCTEEIHHAMSNKGLLPNQHLVDAAYVSADLLVRSRDDYGIDLVGPARQNLKWQSKVEGAYTAEQFTIDWKERVVRCPEGVSSAAWRDYTDTKGTQTHRIQFPTIACRDCHARALCTKAKRGPRRLALHSQSQHEALHAARQRLSNEEGWRLYAHRAGVEGTLSQAVRGFELRRTRYCGLAKTHLQHVATAVAMNVDRITAWLAGRARAKTRTSCFAALAA